jgi:hypothetical protein
MRYRDAFTYVFQSPGWVPNLLILALATLVPLIGPIFAFGYVAVVIESLRWGQNPADYHKIDINRLQDYLLRGLRVFLVSILAALAFVPVYFVFVFGMIFASAAATAVGGGGDSGGAGAIGSALGCLVTVVGSLLLLAAAIAIAMVLLPLQIRASLNPDLGSVFSLSYVRDFIRRMGREALMYHVVLILAGIPLSLVGLLALVIGIFVVVAYIYLVQAHLLAQLADQYEARGGESIGGVGSDTPTPPPLPA